MKFSGEAVSGSSTYHCWYCPMDTRGSFVGCKVAGSEADHSSTCAEVKMRGTIPPLPNTSSWRYAQLRTRTVLLLHGPVKSIGTGIVGCSPLIWVAHFIKWR
jgi:hypothetical protein